ncbi:MAG: SRPBCC family protein [Myxococcota bacterium]
MNVKTSSVIHATPSACWELLGRQFGDIGEWATAIVKSSVDRAPQLGAERTCQLRGMGGMGPMEIHEELVGFNDEARDLTYRVIRGLPKVIRSAQNHWTVEDNGDGTSTISSHATIELAWYMVPMIPMMKMQMGRDLRRVVEELKFRIEEGVPHPRKREAVVAIAS